jgi:16S rRNA (guanine1207-N2)-methyltransferase
MEHYFSEKQSSKISVKQLEINLLGNNLFFLSPSGVFSFGKLDNGSKLLINKAIIPEGKVLDLGCGFGIIGISIAKAHKEKVKVTLSDINERAIHFAEKNSKKNKVDVQIIKSNAFENINEKFNSILFNPPQHAGKKLCFSMIEESKNFLEKNGTLQLVARHNKGGKDLQKQMENVFGNCKHIAIKSGFRIYLSEKD